MVEEKKGTAGKRVTPEQRMHYIGFEVFPGNPKDLFKNEAEQHKFVEGIKARRAKGAILRDECTLAEERVTFGERLVLAVASVAILLALLLPWYSAYVEIVEEAPVAQEVALIAESPGGLVDSAGALLATETEVSDGAAIDEVSSTADPLDGATDLAEGEAIVAESEVTDGEATTPGVVAVDARPNEEIITGHQFKKEVRREFSSLTGLGSFMALGSAGGYVFSSGFALMLSGALMLLYSLCCLGLPFMNMYYIFGVKGTADEKALQLKNVLRLNWLPLLLFIVVFMLSFVGAEYGFDTTGMFTSIGSAYGPGVLLDTLSWGIFVSLAASVLVAVKGVEV